MASQDEEPYALFVVNPASLKFGTALSYQLRYKGSHCTASWVAARRYAVVDAGAAPCPIRSGKAQQLRSRNIVARKRPQNAKRFVAGGAGGNAGAQEGVVAEVTLPALRAAIAMPAGTQAQAEIVGSIATLAVSSLRHLFLPVS
eukprot:COSAG04_NODE_11567_length_701_cov_1.574751_1_plen_144_part_00